MTLKIWYRRDFVKEVILILKMKQYINHKIVKNF